MNYEQFLAADIAHIPDDAPLLRSLWYDAHAQWEQAHEIVQDIPTQDASHVHAYLHRKEGDDANASYWYQKAGQKFPRVSLADEWHQLAKKFAT